MRFTRFLTPLLAAGLLFGAAQPSFAGVQKYPAETPVFSFELPEDWTVEQKTDETKTMVCTMKSDDNVGLLVLTLPKAYTSEEMKVFLPAMAKGQFESQKVTDIKIKDPGEDVVGGTKVTYIVATASQDGTPIVYTFMGYSPAPGVSYELEYIIPAKEFSDRADMIQKILNSFKVLK